MSRLAQARDLIEQEAKESGVERKLELLSIARDIGDIEKEDEGLSD